tara:strand:+ start:462 stop:830 length:369 start_codon:yes stop_codon:yes gene_type:complete
MLEDAYKEMEKKQVSKQTENKFSEEEMGELKEIQKQYIAVQNKLGQLSITKLRLEQQFNHILRLENESKEEYKKTQDQEQEFINTVTEKYGDGQLDLKTGDFEPDKEENNEKNVKKDENDKK